MRCNADKRPMKYTTIYTPTSDVSYFAIYKNTTGAFYMSEIIVEYELAQ